MSATSLLPVAAAVEHDASTFELFDAMLLTLGLSGLWRCFSSRSSACVRSLRIEMVPKTIVEHLRRLCCCEGLQRKVHYGTLVSCP